MNTTKLTVIFYTVLATFLIQGVFLVVYSYNQKNHSDEELIQNNKIRAIQARLEYLELKID